MATATPETIPKPSTSDTAAVSEQAEKQLATETLNRQFKRIGTELLKLKLSMPINTQKDCVRACRMIRHQRTIPHVGIDVEGGTVPR